MTRVEVTVYRIKLNGNIIGIYTNVTEFNRARSELSKVQSFDFTFEKKVKWVNVVDDDNEWETVESEPPPVLRTVTLKPSDR